MYGLKNVRNRRSDALTRVAWDHLERMLADYYRRQGYRVEHCGTGAGKARFDGGIDLKLFRDNAFIVVQCKHWNAKQVTHNHMHELLGIMLTEGATGAILVSSGEFTRYAREAAAKAGNLQLIDGDALRGMLGPLEEPKSSASAADDRAARILGEIGTRVMAAAEDRIRYGSRRVPRSVATAFVWVPLAKGAILMLALAGFILFIQRSLSPANLLPTSHAPQVAAQRSATGTVPVPVPSVPPPALVTSEPDRDAYLSSSQRTPLTEAEIREQQRLADEAMRILAPHTPEMADPNTLPDRYTAPKDQPDQSAGWGR